ncbi:MAG: hypothetical protein AMK72_05645, partial [Planctomycetes bacterium SM23_25]
MAKAIGCISGGLDSMLAVCLIRRQDIEVVALHALHLWHPAPLQADAKPRAVTAMETLGVRVETIDAAEADLEMVRHPKFGMGRQMNPCIDCRIWTLRQARTLMEAEGADFVFTGEVLGQRPMSQNRQAMQLVERKADLADRLVRPLCAKRLPPTRPERDGILDREKLLGIVGRSRKEQMALAREFGITDYPSPAGGCLLTDPAFAYRLREVMARQDPTPADAELLKVGRHFRLGDGTLAVIGRHHEDNLRLEPLFQDGDVRLEAADIPGPTTLLRGSAGKTNVATAAALTLRYTKAPAGKAQRVNAAPVGGEASVIEV